MLWVVPITIATKGNPQAAQLTVAESAVHHHESRRGGGGCLGSGVAYSSDLFSNVTPALSSHTLTARDPLGLRNNTKVSGRFTSKICIFMCC